MRFRLAFVVLLSLACRPRPVDLAVQWVEHAAEYRALTLSAYADATRRLESRKTAGDLPPTWAVVLDVDETLLSNVRYQRERAELGRGYTPQSWTAWVARREATAIAGAPAFVARVRELGGTIAIVTNRTAAECPDTEANLAAVDIVFDLVLCRSSDTAKHARFTKIERGTAGHPAAAIVMFVGDNIEDFPGMTQTIRKAEDDAFADFATELVVLPNPMYGSWTR